MIDWKNKPEGAQRYSDVTDFPWLKMNGVDVYYHECDKWVLWGRTHNELHHYWNEATPQPTITVNSTIDERGERYGKFDEGADIMQSLKNVMRETDGWERLTPSQREALEMIQHKIGRVLNGDPTYDDNWRDICGYSQLILDELNGTKR